MRTKLLVWMFAAFFCYGDAIAQSGNVGIGTNTPGSKMTVNGSFGATYRIASASGTVGTNDYYIAYNGSVDGTLTLPAAISGDGNFLGRIYYFKNTGTAILTVAANGSEMIDDLSDGDGVDSINLEPGEYAFLISKGTTTGTTWEVANNATNHAEDDATRFLGGTVYARFSCITGGTLASSKLINGSAGSSYTVGGSSETSAIGGINILYGNGYSISNPSNGIYDIAFDVPFSTIYGITATLLDSYGMSGGNVANCTNPNPDSVGTRLQTTDNSQVSFISNNIIRLKTGNSVGTLQNRCFSFVVMGQ